MFKSKNTSSGEIFFAKKHCGFFTGMANSVPSKEECGECIRVALCHLISDNAASVYNKKTKC